ncbi:hypothetical protein KIN20_008712 [Parelaphostrongylus tenuis]|uniref:Uncharacterized protein n=1 Tax=Parelaphostrongylus tenuis TaxID=148309 RepID=A0AAD5MN50_PARTN|nr:hypothetical protein KIN20_008712 [Parelaphostrongylus tenuis]
MTADFESRDGPRALATPQELAVHTQSVLSAFFSLSIFSRSQSASVAVESRIVIMKALV